MDPGEFDELLDRYLKGTASDEEKARVEQWYHAIPPSDNFLTDAEAGEIKQRLRSALNANKATAMSEAKARPLDYISWRRYTLPLAACVVSIMIASFLAFNASITAPKASKTIGQSFDTANWQMRLNDIATSQVIRLADGSEITLQPGAVIEYPATFGARSRTVKLKKGSAFFDIRPDASRPFYVYSFGVVTKVLGTSFLVNADAQGSVSVDVKTGIVQVSAQIKKGGVSKHNEVVLRPNQRAKYDPETNSIVRTLVEKPRITIASSQVEDMMFEKAPVASILKAVEAAYTVQIRFDSTAFAACKLTTHLIADEDLHTRLKIICEAIGATYTVVDGHILIMDGKGC